jgi:hypothetical protein
MSLELKRLQKRHWELVDQICEILESADSYKALNALKKVMRERDELRAYVDTVVELLGVDNIGNAIKHLRASGMGRVVPLLPEELLKIPQIWLEGRARSAKDPGFAKFEWHQASREYKRLRPLLEEVWEVIDLEPEAIRERLRAEVIADYETLSPDEMGRYCIAFVNKYDLKEVDQEMEIREAKSDKDPLMSELQKALEATTLSAKDYGVQSKKVNEKGK